MELLIFLLTVFILGSIPTFLFIYLVSGLLLNKNPIENIYKLKKSFLYVVIVSSLIFTLVISGGSDDLLNDILYFSLFIFLIIGSFYLGLEIRLVRIKGNKNK